MLSKQESVTLETLALLRRTADYLARLPVVPATRHLLRDIEAHLADPTTNAAKREAVEAERLCSLRVAGSYFPSGFPAFVVCVDADKVFIRAPAVNLPPDLSDNRTEILEEGITLVLKTCADDGEGVQEILRRLDRS